MFGFPDRLGQGGCMGSWRPFPDRTPTPSCRPHEGGNVRTHSAANGTGDGHGYCVADLLVVLAYVVASEVKPVGKALQACRFTHGYRPVLRRMNVGTPMRIALGKNRRGEARAFQTPVPLG